MAKSNSLPNDQIIKKGNNDFHEQTSCKKQIKPIKNPVKNMLGSIYQKMMYTGKELQTILIDDIVWFRGKDPAEILEYADTDKAIRNHVSEENKSKLDDLLVKLPSVTAGSFDGNSKRGLWISDKGMYELILKSKMKEAKKFQHWICNELLPQIRKTGSYIVPDDKQYRELYTELDLMDYDKKKVIYIAYIGFIDDMYIFKIGKSSNVHRREFKEHRQSFDIFMQKIFLTDNNDEIENLVKRQLKQCNLMRDLEINGKNYTELFTVSADITLEMICDKITDTIKKNPLKAIKDANDKIEKLEDCNELAKLKELTLQAIEKTKQIEAIEKTKQEIEKTKQAIERTKQLMINPNILFIEKLNISELELEIKQSLKQSHQIIMNEVKSINDMMKIFIEKENNKNMKIINQPKKVKTDNKVYVDIYDEYLDINTETSQSGILIKILYEHFENWYSTTYPKTTIPEYKEFKANISKYKTVEDGIRNNGINSIGIKHLAVKFDENLILEFAKEYIVECHPDDDDVEISTTAPFRKLTRYLHWQSTFDKFRNWYSKKTFLPFPNKEVIRGYFERLIFKSVKVMCHTKNEFFKGYKGFKLIK